MLYRSPADDSSVRLLRRRVLSKSKFILPTARRQLRLTIIMASVMASSFVFKQQMNVCRFASVFSLNIKSFYSSYTASPKVKSPDHYTKHHEVSSDNWKFVERLIPPLVVPSFPTNGTYFSEWTPQPDTPPNLPYFVKRTKNFMVPVYLNFEAIRDQRKITMVKHIEGDIWALEKALKSHLEDIMKRPVVSQVHEVAMYIKFRGDYVLNVKKWLLDTGF